MMMTRAPMGPMEGAAVDEVVRRLVEGGRGGRQVQLSEAEIRQLCIEGKRVLLSQPNLLRIHAPVKICELKKSLKAVFGQFGKILDILAFKTLKHKGQAWVVFEDVASATEALKRMQSFPFYGKDMRIQYAKTKSDIVARADGTFVPREKRKRVDEKPEKKQKREQPHDAGQIGMGVNAYPGVYGAPQLTQIPIAGGQRVMMPEIIVPNNILFVQNLPHETTPMMLQMLFCQYPGFKEVRMVEAKPGIAFVEYGDEGQATAAMNNLQNFKITKENQMVITYAKK